MAAVIAAMAQKFANDKAGYHTALGQLKPYEGRGKHKARHHDRGGSRAYQRAAVKTKNRAAHRAHRRG